MASARSWADPSSHARGTGSGATFGPLVSGLAHIGEEGHMPKYVIERSMPGAGRLSAEETQRMVPGTGLGGFGAQWMRGRRGPGSLTLVLVAILAWLASAPAALATPGG